MQQLKQGTRVKAGVAFSIHQVNCIVPPASVVITPSHNKFECLGRARSRLAMIPFCIGSITLLSAPFRSRHNLGVELLALCLPRQAGTFMCCRMDCHFPGAEMTPPCETALFSGRRPLRLIKGLVEADRAQGQDNDAVDTENQHVRP